MRILAISGSLRRGSHNTSLLRAAGDLLPPGDDLVLWDGLRDVPPYDQDDDVEPASAGMFGAVWAQAELRKVLAAMGARVAEVEVAVGHAAEKFDGQGALLDDDVRRQLADALATLLAELGVAIDGRVVFGEAPLDDRAREHADELAVLDDRDALEVLLL
jgi:NAD(P)H-dependent FMN reductase